MSTENTQAAKPTVPTTKILAIGDLTEKAANEAELGPIMPKEVAETVRLYLAGKIEQWWIKSDISGVVFVLNHTNAEDAQKTLDTLPLSIAGMLKFNLIPLSPLAPLARLLND